MGEAEVIGCPLNRGTIPLLCRGEVSVDARGLRREDCNAVTGYVELEMRAPQGCNLALGEDSGGAMGLSLVHRSRPAFVAGIPRRDECFQCSNARLFACHSPETRVRRHIAPSNRGCHLSNETLPSFGALERSLKLPCPRGRTPYQGHRQASLAPLSQ